MLHIFDFVLPSLFYLSFIYIAIPLLTTIAISRHLFSQLSGWNGTKCGKDIQDAITCAAVSQVCFTGDKLLRFNTMAP